MALRLPTFQSLDQIQHADDVEFSQQVETGIANLGFRQTVDHGIEALGHIYNAGMQAVGQQQAPPEQAPLPVVISPRPRITPLTLNQPAAMPQGQGDITFALGDPGAATVDTTQPVPSQASGSASFSPSEPMPVSAGGGPSAPPPAPTTQTPPTPYSNISDAAASKYNVDPSVVRGIIQQESSGDPTAVNEGSGASGLMGLMPGTARELGVDPSNPAAAIDGGVRYLRKMLDMFGGDYTKALAAYDWGPGNVQKWAGDLASLPGETRTYLQNILGGGGDQGATPSSAPQPAPAALPEQGARQPYAGTYTQQNLANGGDPDAWAKCGPVAAFQAAALLGRAPTPSEVEALAAKAGWTGQRGMAGLQSESKLLDAMNIANKAVDGVDWGHVIADVSRGNPVILELPGHEGHYITAQGYDASTGKIDFGSTVGDLTAAKHQTSFTPRELESLGWGTPTASLYLDNPATPAPSVVAGSSDRSVNPVTAQSTPPASGSADSQPTTTPGSLNTSSARADAPSSVTTVRGAQSSPTAPDSMYRLPLGAGSNSRAVVPDNNQSPDPSLPDPEASRGADAPVPPRPPGYSNSALDYPDWRPEDGFPVGQPGTAPTFPQLGVPPGAMLRQPLTDASDSPPDASAPFPTPAPAQPAPASGAGAFQDDQSQNGQVSPWPINPPIQTPQTSTQSNAVTPGVQSTTPIPQAPSGLSGSGTESTWPNTPMSQQIPNEDQTSYPTPDYRTPASPLVTAPPEQPSGRFDPLAGQGAAQPGEITGPALPAGPGVSSVPGSPDLTPRPGEFSAQVSPEQSEVMAILQKIATYGETGKTLAQQATNAIRQGTFDPRSILNLLNVIPYDLYTRARQELYGDAEAIRSSGTDPLLPIRTVEQNLTGRDVLPSVQDINPEGRPASDVIGGTLVGNFLPGQEFADPLGNAALQAAPHVAVAAPGVARAGLRGGLQAAAGAIDRGIEAVRPAVRDIRSGLAANAERTAALDAERVGQGSVSAAGTLGAVPTAPEHVYSPTAPEGYNRMYHGTASDFPAVDPERLDPHGLYGPGYYTTSDPRVAGSYAAQRGIDSAGVLESDLPKLRADLRNAERYAKIEDRNQEAWIAHRDDLQNRVNELSATIKEPPGQVVRPVDVPTDLNLLNADAPLTPDVIDRVQTVVDRLTDPDIKMEFDHVLARARSNIKRDPSKPTDALLNDLLSTSEYASGQMNPSGKMDRGLFTELMQRAGFDGVQHTGGQRVPMMDSAGQPIEHNVNVIFPGSASKVRNAFSGTYGGVGIGMAPPAGHDLGATGGTGTLGAVNRLLGEGIGYAASGGVGAAVNQAQNPDDPNARLKGFAAGVALPLAANRVLRPALRRAGQTAGAEGGALATLGAVPPSNLPPKVQQAVRQAQAQAKPGLSPLQWTMRLAGEIGYSSMIGPATATVNLAGNLLEPLYAIPKEATRGVVRAAQTGSLSALREPGEMTKAALAPVLTLHGLQETGAQMVDALMARGRYAATPGHEPLSQLTSNPIGKAITTGLEVGGRVFSSIPDALFGSIAEHAGEARTAAQMATDAGLSGVQWKARVSQLLADAQQVKAGTLKNPSPELILVIKDGQAYAKRQTFQDELGGIGKGVRTIATLRALPDGNGGTKSIPVLGSMLTPFFNTPWNMMLRANERTPIVGALMNTQHGFDKTYDQVVGSTLVLGLGALASQGLITGAGPNDPQKRSELRSQGWRPYSTMIDGVYVPNRVVGIYGPLMNAAGDVHDAITYAKDKTPGSITSDFLGRTGQQLQQQVYLQGLSNLIQATQAGQNGGLGSGVERYVSSNLTRMVPYASTARAIGTAMDPNERTTDYGKNTPAATTISQQVQGGVGLRGDLPVAQDVLGRPQSNPQQGAGALFAKTSSEKADPTVKAFLDAGVDIPFPRQQITVGGSTLPIDEQERRRWSEVRGAALLKLLGPMTQNGALDRMPPGVRQQVLQQFLQSAADQADARVFSEMAPQDRAQRIRDSVNTKLQKAS